MNLVGWILVGVVVSLLFFDAIKRGIRK